MPFPSRNPILIDQLIRISISDLLRLKMLGTNTHATRIISWKGGYSKFGSVTLVVNTRGDNSYIEFSYTVKSQEIRERFELLPVISHLKKGVVWYMRCNRSGSSCKKLYLNGTHFVGRKAIVNGLYSKQICSKKYKHGIVRDIQSLKIIDGEISKVKNSKYFIQYFAERPTKKYLKLLANIKKRKQLEERLQMSIAVKN